MFFFSQLPFILSYFSLFADCGAGSYYEVQTGFKLGILMHMPTESCY